ncbi:MAG: MerR family transcriptional regulator [Rhizobiales bacterium]|nr:MerR family transcriptional regulator [Hyphomicrobiales bacterium]
MDQNVQTSSTTVSNEASRSPAETTFSITQLAEEFDLTTRAIRFYEDKGLLSPERQGQTRIYHHRDRARLILIVRGRNVGLALSEIREILDLYDLEDGCETQYRVAADKFRKRIESLESQRDEIDLQIKGLQEGVERMEKMIAQDMKDASEKVKKSRKQSMS